MRSPRHLAPAAAALVLLATALLVSRPTAADDLDIYLGLSAGTASAANVMILIDNSSNWARNSQGWTSSSGGTITQGQAEALAIQQAVTFLQGEGQPLNLGLAMLTPYNLGVSTGGGYIRVGVRDVTVSSNAAALQNILTQVYNNVNGGGSSNESCCGMAHKDETAALYEIWKYFSGLTPYTGAPNSQNVWVDYQGNTGGGPGPTSTAGLTPWAQGLTAGFAAAGGGPWQYQTPVSSTKPCAANYIIYIANNSNGQVGSTENGYEPSVLPALSALPATSGLKNGDTWTDEWTRFFYQSGAQIPGGNGSSRVVTYVLDAYNSQNDAGYSASLQAAAVQGGGRYYQVGSTQAVYNALVDILTQIQAVNSTFASASLPVNATNRAQNDNQVFIPMFRPDGNDQPRWVGNLKEYQLINDSGNIALGDSVANPAVNTLTGFPTACALSFWTTDSTDTVHYPNGYWNYGTWQNPGTLNWNIVPESTYAKGTCGTASLSPYADDPDGPVVEKGGVAEVIRKGDNPPATNSNPTWSPAARDVLTLQGLTSKTLVPFNTSNTGLPSGLVNWVLGYDVQDENGNGNTQETRPSIHGDAIHSRPLPVDYGSGAVTVYYGSNDGTLRAVDASTGKERWAFIPPEFYTPAPTPYSPANYLTGTAETPPTGLERLMWSGMADSKDNQISPLIKYFNMNTTGITPAPQPKDYYFDGSIGLYEGAVSGGVPGTVWIYPVMRRGGRMIYAMDVSNPASPQVLWKFGCPSQANDSGCIGGGSNDVTDIGQTWSTPSVAASVLGYSGPVVIVGGGYDPCEDENTETPDCTASGRVEKGAGVYILDAKTGQELKFFSTARSVAADVSLIAVSTVGVVDHAYAVDTGGDIYRVDFNAAGAGSWSMSKVAYTSGGGRKFLYGPALLAAPGNQIYVALGSGDREHPLATEYPYTSDVDNRFYVFKDSLASTSALNLDDTSKMYDFSASSTCSTQGVLPTSSMSGWFMSYDEADEPSHEGEQTVTSAVIAAGMVSFSTNRPVPTSQGTCSTALGIANGYWVNLFNASGGISASGASCGGTRFVHFIGEGLPPSPVLATVPIDGTVEQVIIGAAQLSGGASTAISPQQVGPAIIPKRKVIYWKSSGTD